MITPNTNYHHNPDTVSKYTEILVSPVGDKSSPPDVVLFFVFVLLNPSPSPVLAVNARYKRVISSRTDVIVVAAEAKEASK